MSKLKFIAWWNGDVLAQRATGIRPGSNQITIEFERGATLDEDAIAFWRNSVAQYFPGAHVEHVQ